MSRRYRSVLDNFFDSFSLVSLKLSLKKHLILFSVPYLHLFLSCFSISLKFSVFSRISVVIILLPFFLIFLLVALGPGLKGGLMFWRYEFLCTTRRHWRKRLWVLHYRWRQWRTTENVILFYRWNHWSWRLGTWVPDILTLQLLHLLNERYLNDLQLRLSWVRHFQHMKVGFQHLVPLRWVLEAQH